MTSRSTVSVVAVGLSVPSLLIPLVSLALVACSGDDAHDAQQTGGANSGGTSAGGSSAGQGGSSGAGASSGSAGTGHGGTGASAQGGTAGAAGSDPQANYPDSVRCLPGNNDPRCGPGYDPSSPMDAATLQASLDAGIAMWRTVGTDGACVHCHAPDAIDLAKIGYSDCDLHRRAINHVSEAHAQTLVQYIHALRQVYDVQKPLHPNKFRPLQPGYESFGGATTDIDSVDTQKQDERDEAFMHELSDDLGLLWANGKVDSLAKAHLAYDQLLAIDLPSLKLGIPFDAWTEDPNASSNVCNPNGGPAHLGKSIFEWIPGIPVAPKAGMESQWFALQSAYVANPTTENLWKYYDAIDDMTECAYDLGHNGDPAYYQLACDWMRMKFKSVQIFQHMLRNDSREHPDPLVELRTGGAQPFVGDHLDLFIRRSPIWETGDFLRVNPLQRRGDPACFDGGDHPCTFLPEKIDATIHSIPTYTDARVNQSELFQMTWTMMGFIRDPALLTHSDKFATFIGDYLESSLLPRYDIHHAFVFAQLAVRKSAAKEWLGVDGFRKGTGKIASVRTFSFKQVRNNLSPPTENSPRYATHRRMFGNFARMFLYLVEEDLRTTGTVFGRDGRTNDEGGLLVAMRFLRSWIPDIEGASDPAIDALMRSIEALALDATELQDDENHQEFDGLAPTHTWGDFQAPFE